MPFERLPKIGWWEDNKIVTVYHGTHIRNIDWIQKNGLVPPTEGYTAGIVSLALEPNTAWGYASMSGMGGESGRGVKGEGGKGFRDAGSAAKSTTAAERVVFKIMIPLSHLKKNTLPINYPSSAKKLTDRSLFDGWKKTDQEYYAITELKWKGTLPPKYIVGYMTK
jgi:hypothetical protein